MAEGSFSVIIPKQYFLVSFDIKIEIKIYIIMKKIYDYSSIVKVSCQNLK